MKKHDDKSMWSRRRFLASSAAGAGLIFAPPFLASCGGAKSAASTAPLAGTKPVGGGGPLYFSKFGIDEQALSKVLAEAMGRGGDFADLFFQHRITHYLGLQDGQVDRAYSDIELGCGVRVVRGDQTGFAFTEDLSAEALTSAARTAAVVANAKAGAPNKAFERPGVPDFYPIEVSWAELGIDKKIPVLGAANEVAFGHDPRIVKVQAMMSDSSGWILVARSDGKIFEDFQPMTTCYVNCVAEKDGRREENYDSLGMRGGFEVYGGDRIRDLARTAAKRTVALFDAIDAPAGETPVVLAPGFSGILLHEAIGHGMEADFNRKGTSVYSGRIGERIAPEYVSIVDDGTNPGGRGSINVDDEGTVGQKTVLVENGILRSYMHDRISATHYKVAPTGNGRRESYKHPPVPRMRNTYMAAGKHDPQEIIASVKKGIYAETFTNGQVRIGSGDFSFYLKNGALIEDGKITRPIKDANLIGFGPKVLEQVKMVGTDLALDGGAGTCGKDGQSVPVDMGLPTVLCEGISVGGRG